MPGIGPPSPPPPPPPPPPEGGTATRVSALFRDSGEMEGECSFYCNFFTFDEAPFFALLEAVRALSYSRIVSVTGFVPTSFSPSSSSSGPYDSWDKLTVRYAMTDGSRSRIAIPGPRESLFDSKRRLILSSSLWIAAAPSISAILRSLSGASVAGVLGGDRSRRTPGGDT